jgi:micrococcal nuclease
VRLRLLLALALVAAGLAGVAAPRIGDGDGDGDGGATRDGRVERVVDGDTIVVDGESVRLIGIDTPESVKPGTPVECFAKEASAFTERLVEGRRVRLERDVEERDRYDRLLGYVYRRGDGLFVNAELVRRGYATPATFPPNVRHADEFSRLAREAREAGRGLWSACGR